MSLSLTRISLVSLDSAIVTFADDASRHNNSIWTNIVRTLFIRSRARVDNVGFQISLPQHSSNNYQLSDAYITPAVRISVSILQASRFYSRF